MTDPSPLQLGLALLSGHAGPPWEARAARVRAVLSTVIGPEPPTAPITPPDELSPIPYPRMRPTGPGRAAAIEAAEDLMDGLVMRRFDRVDDLVAAEAWVLWPNGAVGRHTRDAILDELKDREGRRAPVRVTARSSYTYVELKNTLARGLPPALDAMFAAASAVTVSLDLDSPHGRIGRVMLVMGADPATGAWRARNLPFGSPDDAHAASIRPSAVREETLKVAEQVVRKIVLGHGVQLDATRNQLMDKVWVRDQLMPATELMGIVKSGPHRLGSTEIVFMGSQEVPLKELAHCGPRGVKDSLAKVAPDTWGRRLDRLDPRMVVTQLGELDPASGEVQTGQAAASVVIRVQEPGRDEPRRRIAALFI